MELKKSIGKKTLLFLAVNAILDAGIFFVLAIGAFYSGAASILAWIIMAFVAFFISLYFAELVSMFPKAGGVYEYVKKAYGEFPSFIVGWASWLVANISIAMAVVGSLLYLFSHESFVFHLFFSILIIIIFNYISYRGIDYSSRVLLFFGFMSVFTLLILIFPGFLTVDISRFGALVISTPLLMLTLYFVLETFSGWESVTYLAEEVKDARKVLPKVMIISTVIVALLTTFLAFVALGNLDAKTFGEQKAPLNMLASELFGSDFTKIYAVLIFIPLIGTAATWIVSSPRLLFAMARDRVLLPRLKTVHSKYRTPHYAILLQTIITCFVILVALADFEILLSLFMPLVLLIYSFVMLSFTKLRMSMPLTKRYFKAPFGISGPRLIVVLNCILLIAWLEQVPEAINILAMSTMLVFFGVPIYIIIKLQIDERFIEKFFDRFSFFWDVSFRIWYGKNEVKHVVDRLNIKQGHVVLDFGCGTGLTTAELAKRVGPGKVVAVDISEQQLIRASRKIKKSVKLSNVIFVKEHHLKPFEKHSFDAVTVVGVLEHLKDPADILKGIFRLLKPGGSFSLLSFGKSMGIPAPEFLKSRKVIEDFFTKLGVKVKVEVKKKKMTEYIYIWGRK